MQVYLAVALGRFTCMKLEGQGRAEKRADLLKTWL